MCEPTTIIMAITAVMAAYSANQQAKAQKSKAKFDAGVARNNQTLLSRAAEDSVKQGDEAERQYRIKVANLIGRQRAGFAAAGVLVNEAGSSPQDALLDTRTLEARDISTLREEHPQGSRLAALPSRQCRRSGRAADISGSQSISGGRPQSAAIRARPLQQSSGEQLSAFPFHFFRFLRIVS